MISDDRIYTNMSGKALKGLQRLVRDREIYAKPSDGGFTVVTTPKGKRG